MCEIQRGRVSARRVRAGGHSQVEAVKIKGKITRVKGIV